METLNLGNIAKLRNGKVGIVMGAKANEPWLLVFGNFTMRINRFNDNGKCKTAGKEDYDIVEVFDGSEVDTASVFRANFSTEGLKCVWSEAKVKAKATAAKAVKKTATIKKAPAKKAEKKAKTSSKKK